MTSDSAVPPSASRITVPTAAAPAAPRMVVRVLPEVAGLDRSFDYLVPVGLEDRAGVGTMVRVVLQGRRVGGWVLEVDVTPPAGVVLRELASLQGVGPSAELVSLAAWGAWRWAGRTAQLLRSASPPTALASVPTSPRSVPVEVVVPACPGGGLVDDAIAGGAAVVRLAPGIDRFGFLVTAISKARLARHAADPAPHTPPTVLVVCPTIDAARRFASRLGRTGLPVALVADDRPGSSVTAQWARAAAGGMVVVGARGAAWAPAPNLALAVVVDEHDEALQGQQAPTWHARDVLIERCRRAEAPLVMLSPCPTLEALGAGRLLVQSRRDERAGWPPVEVIDRRGEDPATASSLFSERLVDDLRVDGRVVCVLNRTGRARLLACRDCDTLARCETCGAAVHEHGDGTLTCRRCATRRPVICPACGATRFRVLRSGVTRARDELEKLLGEPVLEVTAGSMDSHDPQAQVALDSTRVLIGTEALLRRVGQASLVVLLDFDQELTAPRFRAHEQALVLLTRAARVAGPRSRAHRLVIQTRLAEHPVVQAAVHADPGRVVDADFPLRKLLKFPPFSACALISGQASRAFVDAIGARAVLEILGDGEGAGPWLVRGEDHRQLCAELAATVRPAGRLRIEVDPLRV